MSNTGSLAASRLVVGGDFSGDLRLPRRRARRDERDSRASRQRSGCPRWQASQAPPDPFDGPFPVVRLADKSSSGWLPRYDDQREIVEQVLSLLPCGEHSCEFVGL